MWEIQLLLPVWCGGTRLVQITEHVWCGGTRLVQSTEQVWCSFVLGARAELDPAMRLVSQLRVLSHS